MTPGNLCRLHHAAPPGGLAPLYPLLAPRLRTLDLELERVLPPGRCQADLSGAPTDRDGAIDIAG